MKPVKAMTIRLSPEQADALETVAAVEDKSVSDVIREAIDDAVDARRRNHGFQTSLRQRIAAPSSLICNSQRRVRGEGVRAAHSHLGSQLESDESVGCFRRPQAVAL